MSCSDNSSPCGCKYPSNTNCVTIKGVPTNCIGAFNGKDLSEGLNLIIDYVCDLDTPSGNIYVVDSCDSNITVESETVGDTTTYTVCLDPDIPLDIATNTANIATLSNCVEDGVLNIVSDDITITEEASETCGRTLRLTYTPSAETELDGIIYNDTDTDGTNGGGTLQTLKSFNWNYVSDSVIEIGDEIRIQTTGKTEAVASVVDTIILDLFDATSATQLAEFSLANAVNTAGFSSWRINSVITVVDVDNGDAIWSAEFTSNFLEPGNTGMTNKNVIMIDKEVNLIDWSNLTIRVRYNNISTAGATDNYAKKLMVEVRKNII